MQITKTNTTPTELKMSITATQAELDSVKKHVLGHYVHSLRLPGFRAGKAPLHVIEKQVDPQVLQNEFLEHAINGMYKKALEKETIRPVGQPKVEIKKFVPYTTLEFEVETDVIGTVTLPDYKKIKVPKPPIKVSAEEVNEVLKSLQKRSAERLAKDGPAGNGDEVVIDFSGRDSVNQPIAGTDGKDYPLILGSGQFIPGFEDALIGAKKGDEKEFKVTFPEDYGVKALQSKKVTFRVTVKDVAELKEPKLDDEFAKKAGPFKSLAELKADVKKQLVAERQREADRGWENELVKAVTAKSSVAVPESMIDEEVLRMEEEEKRNLTYRGQTWQEHLKEEGINEEQHRERHRPQAEERIKAGLVLAEIAEREKLVVSDKEVQERIAALKSQYSDAAMQAELEKPDAKGEIAFRLLSEKTIAKLAGFAK